MHQKTRIAEGLSQLDDQGVEWSRFPPALGHEDDVRSGSELFLHPPEGLIQPPADPVARNRGS